MGWGRWGGGGKAGDQGRGKSRLAGGGGSGKQGKINLGNKGEVKIGIQEEENGREIYDARGGKFMMQGEVNLGIQ